MQQNNVSFIKSLSILFIALLTGQIFFAIILLFVSSTRTEVYSSLQGFSSQLLIICIVLGAISFFAGGILFKKKLEAINGGIKAVPEKLNDYRAACITRWALVEFVVLFSLIIFFITADRNFLILSAALILLFISLRPSLSKTATDLGVSEEEIK